MKVTVCDGIIIFATGEVVLIACAFIYNLIFPPDFPQAAIMGAVSGTGSTSAVLAVAMVIPLLVAIYCLYKEPCVGRAKS